MLALMNLIARSPTTQHRLARLIAWAQMMLLWIGAALFFPAARAATGRHIRRRNSLLSLDRMAHMTACLILTRACALARRPRPLRHRRPQLDYAPAGFAKRTRERHFVRSAIGSKLRGKLRHRDLGARLSILMHALADIDAYARELLPRLNRRFTRLLAIIPVRPPHHDVRDAAAPCAPCAADTS
jgi:hypothetical protein